MVEMWRKTNCLPGRKLTKFTNTPMYAIQSSRAVALSAPDTHEDFYWNAQLVSEIEALDPKIIYSKTRLAQMWGVHRNTVRRWVEVATDANTPGFNRAFDQVIKLADCSHCKSEIRLNDLQYLHLKRNWLIECSKCGAGFKAEPRLKEVTDLDMKIPGLFAKVLRIVGYLINLYGIEATKKILSDSPLDRDKKIRLQIRKLLVTGV